MHSIIGKNGKERATNLRDARKLGLVPSVTTVLSVIGKPGLEVWKVRQGILAALTTSRLDGEADDEMVSRILADSKQEAELAAEEGSNIHAAIEASYKGEPVMPEYEEHVAAVRAEIDRLFPFVDDWVAEKTFSDPSGFGGMVDLHSPSTGIVVDVKTKEGELDKRLAYDQHLQIAPYQKGLSLPLSDCANVFVSRTHLGVVASHVWGMDKIASAWKTFRAALDLWKLLNKYDPSTAFEMKEPPFGFMSVAMS